MKTFQIDTLSNVQERAYDVASERIVRLVKLPNKEEAKGCIVGKLSDLSVQTFASAHPDIVREAIEQLQNAVIRQVWIQNKRSATEADIEFSQLAEYWNTNASEDRITKESIKALWASDLGKVAFVNYLAQVRGISLENADNVAMLQQVAANYLPFVQMAAERKPAFDTAAIKEKVVLVLTGFADYLEQKEQQNIVVLKALEKAQNAPVAAVDVDAL